jgi:hypothetical protein
MSLPGAPNTIPVLPELCISLRKVYVATPGFSRNPLILNGDMLTAGLLGLALDLLIQVA